MTAQKNPRGRAVIDRVVAERRAAVRPTKRQAARAKKTADMLLGLVGAESAGHPEITGMDLGGSYKKGTWLARPEMDIDVYIRFNPKTDRKSFRKIAIDVGLSALRDYDPYTKFSDHPYVEARLDRHTLANVVPCYDITEPAVSQWKSAADRSRFHTEYMGRKLTEEMRDDVRILKSFLKANGLYGAQIERGGFSGYVCEVLISHFGSFAQTTRRFAGMGSGHVIGRATKKFDTTISIIDPIDGSRNLAAAISEQNVVRFILACRAFERSPSADFFDMRRATKGLQGAAERKRQQDNILSIRFGFSPRAPDVIWGQTKKSAAKLAKYLEQDGFAVLRHACHVDTGKRTAYLFALLASDVIPHTYQQQGPAFDMSKSLNSFIKKGVADSAMLWVDSQGAVTALKRRDETSALKYAKKLLGSKRSRDGLLPADHAPRPRAQMGVQGLEGAAGDVAGGLIRTDASIIRLS